MQHFQSEKIKERLKSTRSPKSTDFTNSYTTSSSILKVISQPRNHLNGMKKHRSSKSFSKLSPKSFNKLGQSTTLFDDIPVHSGNDSTCKYLNTTVNNTVTIEENFPRYINDIEKSVTVLKKFYVDLCSKKKDKSNQSTFAKSPNSSNMNLNTTQKEDFRGFPKADIETIQKEFERTYNKKTNNIHLLYEFYTNEFLNRSQKSSANLNGINNSNYSASSFTANQNLSSINDNHIVQTPFYQEKFERSNVPVTPSNTNREFLNEPTEKFNFTTGTEFDEKENTINPNTNLKIESINNDVNMVAKTNSNLIDTKKNESTSPKFSVKNSPFKCITTNFDIPKIARRDIEVPGIESFEQIKGSKSPSKSPVQLKNEILSFNLDKKLVFPDFPKVFDRKSLGFKNKETKSPEVKLNEFKKLSNNQQSLSNCSSQKSSTSNLNNEIFSKIYEKNMFINKIKLEINQNIQTLAENQSKPDSQKILDFEEVLNRVQNKEKKLPEWIEQKEAAANNLDEGVIELISDEEHYDDNKDKNLIKERDSQDKLMDLISDKNLHLNNDDLETLQELKDIVGVMSNTVKLDDVMIKKESNLLKLVKTKIEDAEKFKKNKYYVQEIPNRKTKIIDVEQANEEEEKRHEKELKKFYENNKLIDEFENILERSFNNNPETIKEQTKQAANFDFIDEKDFFKDINAIDHDKQQQNTDISFDLEFDLNKDSGKKKGSQEKPIKNQVGPSPKEIVSKLAPRETPVPIIRIPESFKLNDYQNTKIQDPKVLDDQINKLQNLNLKLKKILLILEKEYKLAKSDNEALDIKEKIKKYMKKKTQVEAKIEKFKKISKS